MIKSVVPPYARYKFVCAQYMLILRYSKGTKNNGWCEIIMSQFCVIACSKILSVIVSANMILLTSLFASSTIQPLASHFSWVSSGANSSIFRTISYLFKNFLQNTFCNILFCIFFNMFDV